MLTRNFAFGCVATLMFLSVTATAQQPMGFNSRAVAYQPVMPFPPGMGEFYHHDSTAAGNYMRGRALLAYAESCYRLNCAQAAVLEEYRVSLAIHNRQQLIENNNRNYQQKASRRQDQLSKQRAKNVVIRTVRDQAASAIVHSAVNRETGAIDWPLVLQSADYDTDRANIEFQFRRLASCTGRPAMIAALAGEFTENLRHALEDNRTRIGLDEYSAAANFLRLLKRDSESHELIENVASMR